MQTEEIDKIDLILFCKSSKHLLHKRQDENNKQQQQHETNMWPRLALCDGISRFSNGF